MGMVLFGPAIALVSGNMFTSLVFLSIPMFPLKYGLYSVRIF